LNLRPLASKADARNKNMHCKKASKKIAKPVKYLLIFVNGKIILNKLLAYKSGIVVVQRLKYLDAIRGLSALSVVFSHFLERTPLHESWLLSHFNLGQFGVIMFFIISGMVIPYSIKFGQGGIKSFLISRFFRLYPAYWFSVFMAVLSSVLFYKLLPATKVILFNLTMFQSVFRVPDLFGVYWTLILELMFYTGCVLLFSLGLLKNKKSNFIISISFLVVAIILSCVRWFVGKKIPVFIPLYMSLMFFGTLWKGASINNDPLSRLYCAWLCVIYIVSLPFICCVTYNVSHLYTYLSAIIFFIVVSKVKLSLKPFVFLGTVSYSMYLLHPFALEFFASTFNLHNNFSFLVFFLYLIMVILLSCFSYFLIEKPSSKLGRLIKTGLLKKNELAKLYN
jgi:peptidoglycan/LPS O-acetylase OafA/YrhL